MSGSLSKAVMYSRDNCPWCDKAKTLLTEVGIPYEVVDLDTKEKKAAFAAAGFSTVPIIYIDGFIVGGYDDLAKIYVSPKTIVL